MADLIQPNFNKVPASERASVRVAYLNKNLAGIKDIFTKYEVFPVAENCSGCGGDLNFNQWVKYLFESNNLQLWLDGGLFIE